MCSATSSDSTQSARGKRCGSDRSVVVTRPPVRLATLGAPSTACICNPMNVKKSAASRRGLEPSGEVRCGARAVRGARCSVRIAAVCHCSSRNPRRVRA
eukprot:5084195-Prymnesium_polylepis.1